MITSAMIAGLGIGLLDAGPASSQGWGSGPGMMQGPGAGRGGMMLAWFDTNGDGKITREEFETGHAQRFEVLDADGDGKVTLEEFQSQGMGRNPARKQMSFRRIDAIDDGATSRDEFGVLPDFRFNALDLDHNGMVTQAELQQARQQFAQRGQGMGQGSALAARARARVAVAKV